MKRIISTLIFLFISSFSFAQDAGLDDRINEAFTPIADWWGAVVLHNFPGTSIPTIIFLLVGGALFFTIYFGFINVRRFPLAINVVRGKFDHVDHHEVDKKAAVNVVDGDAVDTIKDESQDGEVSHFQALATAVSGTVGNGNIAGVALAIAIGGPGATFWMILCGLIGMSTKFVECTLGVKYRDVGEDGTVYGGPMYYLTKGLKERGFARMGRFLAVTFALLCIGASFGGGNAAQSNQAAMQLVSSFGMEGGSARTIIGVLMMIFVGIIIIGGIKRIASVTEKIVPFMALLYVGACLYIILTNFSFVDNAFAMIFTQAFNPQAGLGGLLGVLITGFRRAAFSNEAGAGSASIAHSAVKTKYAASEGLVALLEPFIDTVVICTMTALVIIIFNGDQTIFNYGGENGIVM
ncbi:MAG: alanine/glycine:cation symporter family protein, partial [Flavobacteriaceae bacterium]